jgi:hypothetical protein
MSNDPLGLSYFWSGPPDEANYDAIYAAIVATDRGRWFLTEFASRNRHIDTRALVRAIGRVEGAIRGQAPPSSADVLCRDLIDLAAAIGRIEAELAAGTAQALDVLAASERIQDIAFALREREVSAALCDALDAAAREVAEACARNDATTQHASQAALLLRDLGARVNDMIGSAMTGEAEAPDLEDRLVAKAAIDHDLLPPPHLFGAEARGNRNIAPDIATHGVTPPPSVDGAGLLGRGMTMYRASREEPSAEMHSDQALPINEIFTAARSRAGAPAEQIRHDELLLAMDLGAVMPMSRHRPAGPREDPADLFETPPPPPPPPRAAPAPRVGARQSAPKPEQRHRVAPRVKSPAGAAAPPAPQPRSAAVAARAEARPGASDPMRAVRALTEAELIALFG